MNPRHTGGRLVAWAGFVFGSVMSIAANVLYTWLPAADMQPGWAPSIAAQIGAAVWPVGLLLSVEVLSRVAWQDGWPWKLARYGGAGVVALGSAIISYGHLNGVLIAWNYGQVGAAVGPLVLDGLMVVSGFALLSKGVTEPERVEQPASPRQWVVADIEQRPDGEVVGHVVEAPTPQPEPTRPAPRKRLPAKPPAIADLVEKARPLVAKGVGRPTVAKELDISPTQARQVIDVIKSEQAPNPEPTPAINGKAFH